jgi:hypothetical protein
MDTIIQFAALLLVAAITLFLGMALDWLLLRGMFRLMQPAGASRKSVAVPIERGAQLVASAYSQTR